MSYNPDYDQVIRERAYPALKAALDTGRYGVTIPVTVEGHDGEPLRLYWIKAFCGDWWELRLAGPAPTLHPVMAEALAPFMRGMA